MCGRTDIQIEKMCESEDTKEPRNRFDCMPFRKLCLPMISIIFITFEMKHWCAVFAFASIVMPPFPFAQIIHTFVVVVVFPFGFRIFI